MQRVLAIDDEEKLRHLSARIVKLEGFEIFEAGNLKAAQKIIEKDERGYYPLRCKITRWQWR